MEEDTRFTRLCQQIDSYGPEGVALQARLTAFAAVGPTSGGPGEWPKALFLRNYLRQLGVDGYIEHNAPDDRVAEKTRPNMVAWIKGTGQGPKVWVMAHMDVVPAGDRSLWQSEPFELVVDGDRLIGRGTEDNQHGLVAGLMALKSFRDTGLQPAGDFGLVLVSDEETGNKLGIGYLLEQAADLFSPEDIIIVPDAGNPEGTMIEVAEKSILWVRLRTVGKQCHASTPDQGKNAFVAASHLVVRLRELYRLFDRQDPVYDPARSTFEATKKEANVPNVNTIPGEDVFYVDCRILPEIPVDRVLEQIRSLAGEVAREHGVQVELEVVQRADAAPATAVDAAVVRALMSGIEVVHGKMGVPMGIGGGTVAALFRHKGFPAAVWGTMHETCHQPNEHTLLSNLLADAKVLAHVALYGS
ncbi:MAG: M20 family metallo-hydrolase [Deltaproteobacteria bacterium]|nr:M20 family metallo-hydrolase [Deltaproteobacteria bacterium]